jgi:hypothetical protein
VKLRIAADKENLAEAQNRYDIAKCQSIVDSILNTTFAPKTIAAAYTGQGKLAEALIGHEGGSLASVLVTSVKAGEVMT